MTRCSALLFLSILFVVPNAVCAGPQTAPPEAQPVPKQASKIAPNPTAKNSIQKEITKKVLLVFGDSLAAGYGVPAGQSFPDDLQRKIDALHYPWSVVNLGVSGDTTMGGTARVNIALALKPSLVLLELGGNDGLRGLPLSATRDNLEQIILEFQRDGARVVLAGMTLPPNYGPDYVHGFEKIYKDLAAKYKLALIPFLLSDIITPDLRYFQRDGIHPTAVGAQIVAGTVMRTLRPFLAVKN